MFHSISLKVKFKGFLQSKKGRRGLQHRKLKKQDAHASGTGALGVLKGQSPLSQSKIYFCCGVAG
ncbi:hypothetical protein [Campylobacter sp. VTCC 70190]|uniref:hypothetical protein n=1 Tax=Campylobacter sp. VTCC 70190 TaxID=3392118 RepID=UPI00398F0125